MRKERKIGSRLLFASPLVSSKNFLAPIVFFCLGAIGNCPGSCHDILGCIFCTTTQLGWDFLIQAIENEEDSKCQIRSSGMTTRVHSQQQRHRLFPLHFTSSTTIGLTLTNATPGRPEGAGVRVDTTELEEVEDAPSSLPSFQLGHHGEINLAFRGGGDNGFSSKTEEQLCSVRSLRALSPPPPERDDSSGSFEAAMMDARAQNNSGDRLVG